MATAAWHLHVEGVVQGVGFRPFVFRLATQFGLKGRVWNHPGGVEIEVEGALKSLELFLAALQQELPRSARIDKIVKQERAFEGFSQFTVAESSKEGSIEVTVMPDLALCDECRAEMLNPKNRRYCYPFINCTQCGPRYSIVESLPYDRSRTTMKHFKMCELCEGEYRDPLNRRFHAEPNACAHCGPRLQFFDKETWFEDQPLERSVALLKAGGILALKGIGGYQLLANALDDQAVELLRSRKRRPRKPFAVMIYSLNELQDYCELSPLTKSLLKSPQAPIVLLKSKSQMPINKNPISRKVAPANPYLGVMLPYSPLHWLLMEQLPFPVIATSGNLSEEPIAISEEEATSRLSGIADGFLAHNRPIFRPTDDSVIALVGEKPMMIRRARGYAPLPLNIDKALSSHPIKEELLPLVALGGDLKNSVAVTKGREIVLSQYLGDLANELSFERFQTELKSLSQLYGHGLGKTVCDLHPEYHSTAAAGKFSSKIWQVQHHEAHLFGALAECAPPLPCLGVVWDGTGWGSDGQLWGGEFFEVKEDYSVKRIAHLRPFPLLGGERAIIDPRRVALALQWEIDSGRPESARALGFDEQQTEWLRALFHSRKSQVTSSIGRLFDGVSALLGFSGPIEYEGEAAMVLEYLAALGNGPRKSTLRYDFKLNQEVTPWSIDWRSGIATLIADRAQVAPQEIAWWFHQCLVELITRVAQAANLDTIVLSGGCFQNRLLLESLEVVAKRCDLKIYWPQQLPLNDGGLAAGQIFRLLTGHSGS